ncbi:hypothetical protein CC1G_12785 [Coprinopsis cinerea okayama7|uniref:Uncharacterized protein n=1 Tax=Coprinopsis cinerea (strain Okayama-7 / 130 / ATCC MYA-4618 / FGSC 9003) TaxID=240176 RepID=A8PHU2_COPC7|nr:hypothetical protein CC1G_12785 [Coprinopsis cinerea okayama7\|eukprot:XP_001841465.2 hypothetical protein CC1G_12785 [Coprinopsis cinerea okayama7\
MARTRSASRETGEQPVDPNEEGWIQTGRDGKHRPARKTRVRQQSLVQSAWDRSCSNTRNTQASASIQPAPKRLPVPPRPFVLVPHVSTLKAGKKTNTNAKVSRTRGASGSSSRKETYATIANLHSPDRLPVIPEGSSPLEPQPESSGTKHDTKHDRRELSATSQGKMVNSSEDGDQAKAMKAKQTNHGNEQSNRNSKKKARNEGLNTADGKEPTSAARQVSGMLSKAAPTKFATADSRGEALKRDDTVDSFVIPSSPTPGPSGRLRLRSSPRPEKQPFHRYKAWDDEWELFGYEYQRTRTVPDHALSSMEKPTGDILQLKLPPASRIPGPDEPVHFYYGRQWPQGYHTSGVGFLGKGNQGERMAALQKYITIVSWYNCVSRQREQLPEGYTAPQAPISMTLMDIEKDIFRAIRANSTLLLQIEAPDGRPKHGRPGSPLGFRYSIPTSRGKPNGGDACHQAGYDEVEGIHSNGDVDEGGEEMAEVVEEMEVEEMEMDEMDVDEDQPDTQPYDRYSSPITGDEIGDHNEVESPARLSPVPAGMDPDDPFVEGGEEGGEQLGEGGEEQGDEDKDEHHLQESSDEGSSYSETVRQQRRHNRSRRSSPSEPRGDNESESLQGLTESKGKGKAPARAPSPIRNLRETDIAPERYAPPLPAFSREQSAREVAAECRDIVEYGAYITGKSPEGFLALMGYDRHPDSSRKPQPWNKYRQLEKLTAEEEGRPVPTQDDMKAEYDRLYKELSKQEKDQLVAKWNEQIQTILKSRRTDNVEDQEVMHLIKESQAMMNRISNSGKLEGILYVLGVESGYTGVSRVVVGSSLMEELLDDDDADIRQTIDRAAITVSAVKTGVMEASQAKLSEVLGLRKASRTSDEDPVPKAAKQETKSMKRPGGSTKTEPSTDTLWGLFEESACRQPDIPEEIYNLPPRKPAKGRVDWRILMSEPVFNKVRFWLRKQGENDRDWGVRYKRFLEQGLYCVATDQSEPPATGFHVALVDYLASKNKMLEGYPATCPVPGRDTMGVELQHLWGANAFEVVEVMFGRKEGWKMRIVDIPEHLRRIERDDTNPEYLNIPIITANDASGRVTKVMARVSDARCWFIQEVCKEAVIRKYTNHPDYRDRSLPIKESLKKWPVKLSKSARMMKKEVKLEESEHSGLGSLGHATERDTTAVESSGAPSGGGGDHNHKENHDMPHESGHTFGASDDDDPHNDYHPPRHDHNDPHNDYDDSRNNYEDPHNDYEDPHNDYDDSRNDYEGRRNDYEGRRNDYEGRRNDYEGRRNDYEGRRNDYEGRRNVYEGPHNVYEGPHNVYDDVRVNSCNRRSDGQESDRPASYGKWSFCEDEQTCEPEGGMRNFAPRHGVAYSAAGNRPYGGQRTQEPHVQLRVARPVNVPNRDARRPEGRFPTSNHREHREYQCVPHRPQVQPSPSSHSSRPHPARMSPSPRNVVRPPGQQASRLGYDTEATVGHVLKLLGIHGKGAPKRKAGGDDVAESEVQAHQRQPLQPLDQINPSRNIVGRGYTSTSRGEPSRGGPLQKTYEGQTPADYEQQGHLRPSKRMRM